MSKISRFERIDELLTEGGRTLYTLAPGRERASLPSEVAASLLRDDDAHVWTDALFDGMYAVIAAIVQAFPDNLFWDLDALFGLVMREARALNKEAEWLAESLIEIAELQALFGPGPVNFRYIHDFTYGFDWARWVKRDPDARADVGPYSRVFIAAMHRRGRELIATIERDDDAVYPKLPPNADHRNPFGFARTVEAEERLFRVLASQGNLPVFAWATEPSPDWTYPYSVHRKETARALGLAMDEDPL